MEFEPPSYAPRPAVSQTSPGAMSITDLRNQIVANATVIFPRRNNQTYEQRQPDLVVAKSRKKLPKLANEKEASLLADAQGMSAQAMASAVNEQHYALLLRESNSKTKVKILLRGEPKETVSEALEWMLNATEEKIHEMAVKYGADSTDPECLVM